MKLSELRVWLNGDVESMGIEGTEAGEAYNQKPLNWGIKLNGEYTVMQLVPMFNLARYENEILNVALKSYQLPLSMAEALEQIEVLIGTFGDDEIEFKFEGKTYQIEGGMGRCSDLIEIK